MSLRGITLYLCVARAQQPDHVKRYLKGNGTQTQSHYPPLSHKQNNYTTYNYLSLPIAGQLAKKALSLPISPAVSKQVVLPIERGINGGK